MRKLLLLLLYVSFAFGQTISIKHTAYDITFDTVLKEPVQSHYLLLSKNWGVKKSNRSANFHKDSFVSSRVQGSKKDYKNSGYDKGHLSPNNDFRYSRKTQKENMVYTNVCPQNKWFNEHLWLAVENYVRNIQKKYDVEVWTGTIFPTTDKKYAGTLLIPSFYWKVIKYNGIYEAWKIPNIEPNHNSNDFSLFKVDYKTLIKW